MSALRVESVPIAAGCIPAVILFAPGARTFLSAATYEGQPVRVRDTGLAKSRTQNIITKTQTGSAPANRAATLPVRAGRAFGRGLLPKAGVFATVALLAVAASSSFGQVFPPNSHPYGVSYQEWAARFWQRLLSLPVDAASYSAPLSDGQSGEVWLLASPLASPPSATLHFSIPAGKAMLICPLSYWTDNGNCPSFTDFTVSDRPFWRHVHCQRNHH